MMHIAYPNVVYNQQFIGCGRYLSLARGQAAPAGYHLAGPNARNITHILRAVQHFAPEVDVTTYPLVYERDNGQHHLYYGSSLELAYLLAAIRCVRRLRLGTGGLSGDVWCTGRLTQRPDGTCGLEQVDQGMFAVKLQAFLSHAQDPYQPEHTREDRLFLVPALNFTSDPQYRRWCDDGGAAVVSLHDLAPLAAGEAEWGPHKRVVSLRDDALPCLVESLFERPERILRRAPIEVVQTVAPAAEVASPISTPRITALHQLPPPPRDFTGRQAELAELLTALEQEGTTIVGLYGLGGIGKTTLALTLAQHMTPRYPDAQLSLHLKGSSAQPLSVAEIAAQVLHAYHPAEPLPERAEELQGLYQSVLHGQRALLLMDDAVGKEQVEPLIPPPSCLLLVTSRHYFPLPGLCAKRLDVLPPAEACALLLAIAPRIGEHAAAMAQLCGYLPLALRLAASVLAERIDLSPGDYMQRLTDTEQRLRLTGAEASLRTSFALLSPELQRQWCALAVFPDTFDAQGAAAVWELEPDLVRDTLSSLVAWSLVEWNSETARYRLHDLVRLFAERCLGESERDTIRQRHAAHYKTVAAVADDLYGQGGEALGQGLTLWELEWGNMQAGQSWAETYAAHNEVAAALCMEYPHTGRHLALARQPLRQRIRWLEAAWTTARRVKNYAVEVDTLPNLAEIYSAAGEPRRAIECSEQLLAITRAIGDHERERFALSWLGSAYGSMGEHRRAVECYEQSLRMTREAGIRAEEWPILGFLGHSYTDLGEYERALECFEQVLTIARESEDRNAEGGAMCSIGEVYHNLGEHRRAIEYYEQYLVLIRDTDDLKFQALGLQGLGQCYSSLGEHRRAIEYYEQVLAIERELGERKAECSNLMSIGTAYERLGKDEQAIEFYEQSLAIAREMDRLPDEGEALFWLGLASHRLGKRTQALVYANAALNILEQLEHPRAVELREFMTQWQKNVAAVSIPVPHPAANPARAAQLNIQYSTVVICIWQPQRVQ